MADANTCLLRGIDVIAAALLVFPCSVTDRLMSIRWLWLWGSMQIRGDFPSWNCRRASPARLWQAFNGFNVAKCFGLLSTLHISTLRLSCTRATLPGGISWGT